MHGSTGGSWRRSTLTKDTGVAQPNGKPAEHKPRDLPASRCHRASSRPNHPRPFAVMTQRGGSAARVTSAISSAWTHAPVGFGQAGAHGFGRFSAGLLPAAV